MSPDLVPSSDSKSVSAMHRGGYTNRENHGHNHKGGAYRDMDADRGYDGHPSGVLDFP